MKPQRLIFVYDSKFQDTKCDVKIILKYLNRLTEFDIKVNIVDTREISDSDRMKLYFDATVGSVIQKAAIRKQFGSNRDPGFMFGKHVPALMIMEGEICVDVYPQTRSIIDGQDRSIESYLENTIKTLEFFASQSHLESAQLAFKHRLHHAAILYCLLAIDGFIWRALWGRNDITWIGIDHRRHSYSSVDFVYEFGRKNENDFIDPKQFRNLRNWNRKLFDQLRDSDSFLLGQGVNLGIVKPHEAEIVKKIRNIRNMYSHFNPYEKTLSSFINSVRSLGVKELESFSDLEIIAENAVQQTSNLLIKWKGRIGAT